MKITYDEAERIILDTEPAALSDKGDKIWTRRMAVALADLFNARLEALSAAPASAEPVKVKVKQVTDALREYSKDWRDRAATTKPIDDAMALIGDLSAPASAGLGRKFSKLITTYRAGCDDPGAEDALQDINDFVIEHAGIIEAALSAAEPVAGIIHGLDLLSEEETRALLTKAESLWRDLERNELGGYSYGNRPFYILCAFKEVIEDFGKRNTGHRHSKNEIDAHHAAIGITIDT